MKKISYEMAKQRFANRDDIELLKKGYRSWKEKAIFLDLILDEIFEAIPKNVYYQRSTHPKRAIERRKKTNLEKYGNACSLHGNNVDGLAVQKKTLETWKKKYGVQHPFSSPCVKNKVRKTVKKKYGVTNVSQLKKKTVVETGEYVDVWFQSQNEPKPANYQSFGSMFLFGMERMEFTESELNSFLEIFRSSKTRLELMGEQVFGCIHYNQKVLSYRPDFKLNSRVFVNVDGLYWHSELQKDKWYHWNIRKAFEGNGFVLLQFREDEIYKNQELIRSIIDSKLNVLSQKKYARKLMVARVVQEEAEKFLNEHHLMGSICATHIGLYSEQQLVAILSYKQMKNICNIERFCTRKFTNVCGGFSKMLSYLEQNCLKPEISTIHNWVDLRYGTGTFLNQVGFVQARETLGWKWTDGHNTFNRLRCRANMDERGMSEREHAAEKGWYRIYDAGQRLYEKRLSGPSGVCSSEVG